ncbi:MAG TPA: hypothetical protein VKQ08_12715, partial [Cyclobacteriaceae bacterium]|nr:hypothetical protein [Cyclobacteriaceae bacterium]
MKRKMKPLSCLSSCLLVFYLQLYAPLCGQPNARIVTGAEQVDMLLPLITGKPVALMVNNTAVIGTTHLVDSLLHLKINIK